MSSVGLTRLHYPHIYAVLTCNNPDTELKQEDLTNLIRIYESFVLQYGIEMGTAMFDGYIYENKYSTSNLSLVGVQAFKPEYGLDNQIKIVSVGSNAVVVHQKDTNPELYIQGHQSEGNFLGHTGSTHDRRIVAIDEKKPTDIIIAPAKYGTILEKLDEKSVIKKINDTNNRIATLMGYGASGKVPKGQKSLMHTLINPANLELVQRPKWNEGFIYAQDIFTQTRDTIRNSLSGFGSLEVNILSGHLHSDRRLSTHQYIAVNMARLLRDSFSKDDRVHFRNMPLVDNLHVRDIFDYPAYIELFENIEFPVEVVLTEDSALMERIGYDILRIAIKSDKQGYDLVYDGDKSMTMKFQDGTLIQLASHIDKGGVLACVPFDLAQVYYRHAPGLLEKIFREDILANHPDSELASLLRENSNKTYHQIMFDEVYSNPDIKGRNQRRAKIFDEVRVPFSEIRLDGKTPYLDALKNEIADRHIQRDKKAIALYILEGSYDAQFDRFQRLFKAVGINGIETYRLTFNPENANMQLMSVN